MTYNGKSKWLTVAGILAVVGILFVLSAAYGFVLTAISAVGNGDTYLAAKAAVWVGGICLGFTAFLSHAIK